MRIRKLGNVISAALGLLASAALLPMVINIPGIWRVYGFFGEHYTAIALGLAVTWFAVTIWVVKRAERSRPYWLFVFGIPVVWLAPIYLLFWGACSFFDSCI